MVWIKREEIRQVVRYGDSTYPTTDLKPETLPAACQEIKQVLGDSLLFGFEYNPKHHLWERHGLLGVNDALRLDDCIHIETGETGPRLYLNLSVVLPDETDYEKYSLVLRQDRMARYQPLESSSSKGVGGILFVQQRVPGRKEYGLQKLILAKK